MNDRPKRKSRRADGKVFWGMKGNKEIWITEEQFEKWDEARKKYTRKRAKQWQKNLPVEQRIKKGTYDSNTDLYFYGYSGIGKPIWITKDKFENYKEKARICRKNYYDRLKKLPLPKYCIGDKHPEDPNLVVVRLYGNKVCWGTEDQAKSVSMSRLQSYKKYRENRGQIRKASANEKKQKVLQFLSENPHLKRSRGDKDLVLNRIFWGYSVWGTEMWMTPEKFEAKVNKAKLARNILREKKKNERCK